MDSPICVKPPKNVNFFINSIIHIFILLTIISAFFFVYVSNLARSKFHNELADTINDNLTPALEKADKDQYIKDLLKNIQPQLNQASVYFQGENESTTIENQWLMKTTILIIAMLVLTTVIIIIILKLFCKKIPFTVILRENIILFTLVGAVEIMFFLFIAKNFIPTKPSLVIQTLFDSLKKNLNN